MQEQGLHHKALSPWALSPSTVMRPLAWTWKIWSRQKTVRPQKLATKTAKDKASRTGSSHGLAGGRPSAFAIARAVAHLRRQDITRKMEAVKPNPVAAATRAAIARGWASTDPAKPKGATARTVRAQRSSCRHRLAKDGSDTRASTM